MIRQSSESKLLFRGMPAKMARMSATRVLARICRPGKEHARPVVAEITVLPGVSSRAPDMLCSRGVGQPRHREDDGNSALARMGYQQPQQQQYQQDQQYMQYQPEQQQNMILGPIASRLGPRSLAPDDARFKLDRIY
jgi:hypothetical protein